MSEIFSAVVFFLPAGIANLLPPIFSKIPVVSKWQTPLDFGLSWRGKRILGDNKTWRGLVFGTLCSILAAFFIDWVNPDIFGGQTFIIGFLLGLGALVGDVLESFAKRLVKIKPGESWFPYDQIDFIAGGLVFASLAAEVTWFMVAVIFLVYFCLHLMTSYIGYLLKLKTQPI